MASLSSILTFVAILAFFLALAAAGVYLYKTVYPEKSARFFSQKVRRLEFIERAHLEGGRKLLLVRRDDVEHLILIGGPMDLVVETGIRPECVPAEESIEESVAGVDAEVQSPEQRGAWRLPDFPLASRLDLAISGLRSDAKETNARGEIPEPKLSMSPQKDNGEDGSAGLTTVQEAEPVPSN